MAGSTNFKQWNPGAANQENDAAYAADPQRTGGAANDSAFPSPTANKLFFQTTTGITALMQMMATKGFVVNDTNIATLASTLSALLTTADVRGNLQVLTYSPTIACNIGSFLGFKIPLSGNTTITVSGQVAGDLVSFEFDQDGTGGHTVTWPGNFFGAVQPDGRPGARSVQQFKVSSALDFLAATPDISDVGVVNTPIGASGPATGAFTSLTANTPASSDNSTNAATTAWAKTGLVTTIAVTGSLDLPDWLGGLIIKWGTTSGLAGSGGSIAVHFATNFPTSAFLVVVATLNLGGLDRISYYSGLSTSGFTASINGNQAEVSWIALGH